MPRQINDLLADLEAHIDGDRLCEEAAETIRRLRDALRPFAKAALGSGSENKSNEFLIWQELSIGHLREAFSAFYNGTETVAQRLDLAEDRTAEKGLRKGRWRRLNSPSWSGNPTRF